MFKEKTISKIGQERLEEGLARLRVSDAGARGHNSILTGNEASAMLQVYICARILSFGKEGAEADLCHTLAE
jgi:hypothetical protein